MRICTFFYLLMIIMESYSRNQTKENRNILKFTTLRELDSEDDVDSSASQSEEDDVHKKHDFQLNDKYEDDVEFNAMENRMFAHAEDEFPTIFYNKNMPAPLNLDARVLYKKIPGYFIKGSRFPHISDLKDYDDYDQHAVLRQKHKYKKLTTKKRHFKKKLKSDYSESLDVDDDGTVSKKKPNKHNKPDKKCRGSKCRNSRDYDDYDYEYKDGGNKHNGKSKPKDRENHFDPSDELDENNENDAEYGAPRDDYNLDRPKPPLVPNPDRPKPPLVPNPDAPKPPLVPNPDAPKPPLVPNPDRPDTLPVPDPEFHPNPRRPKPKLVPTGGIGYIGHISSHGHSGVMTNQWIIDRLSALEDNSNEKNKVQTLKDNKDDKKKQKKIKTRMCILNSYNEYCIAEENK